MQYDHKKIEKKWQDVWAQNKIYTTPDSAPAPSFAKATEGKKENFFLLVEFPYPSGNLHVGHWYAFAVPDILARFHRMQGKNVLYPIGFDAFGLPAENAAIKNGVNPRVWTDGNIAFMKKQIESMGTSFDWSRQLATYTPDYYKWTQWLFLKLHEKGLVYQKETAVNWCPNDKTVLANEQVVDGKCERCSHEVEQRQMLQWNIKITDYADRLIDDLDALDWPQEIKESQKNWIGRSEGAEIDFLLADSTEKITVFTTRPDTLFGATYLVLAPEHEMVKQLQSQVQNGEEIEAYVDRTQKMSDMDRQTTKEKTGVQLKGVEAINPATGEKIPMFIADYVLPQYGTGAIMAVPAHDERDNEFARKFDLPIKQVVAPHFFDTNNPPRSDKESAPMRHNVHALVRDPRNDTYLCLRWKQQPWTTFVVGGADEGEDVVTAALRELKEETGYINVRHVRTLGTEVVSEYYAAHKDVNRLAFTTAVLFELVDDTRTDISSEESEKHEPVWLTLKEFEADPKRTCAEFDLWRSLIEKDTPFTEYGVLINSGEYNNTTSEEAQKIFTEKFGRKKTTFRLRDWIVSRQRYWGVPIPMIHCEKCGSVPVPDTQLPVILPEVEDYLPEGTGKSPLAKVDSFVNTTCPKCGGSAKRETDTFDTFVDSSWYFLRYTDAQNQNEFASRASQDAWMPVDLYSGGAEHTTMHLLYSRFWHKALFDMGLVKDPEPYKRRMNRSLIMGPDGQKMSKSRGNVIDPDEVVKLLGADTVRMYMAFMGPYGEVSSYPWNPDGVVGVRRFLERVARAEEYIQEQDVASLNGPLHKAIKKIGEDIALMKFNTGISQLMILQNAIEKDKKIGKAQFATMLQLLSPFAPHLSEELWNSIGNTESIHVQSWPTFDAKYLVDDELVIAVQIDGKTRGEFTVSSDSDKATIETAAREAVATRLEGKTIVRTIVVPKRLVNFVLSDE